MSDTKPVEPGGEHRERGVRGDGEKDGHSPECSDKRATVTGEAQPEFGVHVRFEPEDMSKTRRARYRGTHLVTGRSRAGRRKQSSDSELGKRWQASSARLDGDNRESVGGGHRRHRASGGERKRNRKRTGGRSAAHREKARIRIRVTHCDGKDSAARLREGAQHTRQKAAERGQPRESDVTREVRTERKGKKF